MSGPVGPRARAAWREPGWRDEARRKAIHIGFLVLPLALLHEPLAWPRAAADWRWLLAALVAAAIVADVVRIHDHRVRRFCGRFLSGLIRAHEQAGLLGSTYLLLGALLALEIFPRPVAAAAIGFAVLGDGIAGLVGRGWGRRPVFDKTVEGVAAGFAACLGWAVYLAAGGFVAWPAALAGAAIASLIELLPIPLDDNLGMPLGAGYAMLLTGAIG